MNTTTSWVLALVLAAGTIGGGLWHGHVTHRWGLKYDGRVAKERMSEPLPDRVGAWRMVRETLLAPEIVKILQCTAHVARVYQNEQTGDVVSVFVLLGPAGPTAVHTPEICYSAQDYSLPDPPKRTTIKAADGKEHVVWDLVVQPRAVNREPLRAMYGWSTGGDWEAPEYTRLKYGGLPHLYKIQIAGPPAPIAEGKGTPYDPCTDFLAGFMAQMRSRLVGASGQAGLR